MKRAAFGADPSSAERLSNLQVLRAVAALIVVLSHAVVDVARATGDQMPEAWPGPFGVEIFFVISGFIITKTSEGKHGPADAATFAWHRLWRVAPLYWLATTAYVALASLLPGSTNRGVPDGQHVLGSYLFIPFGGEHPVYAVGWSLDFEIFFYAAFAIAMLHRHGVLLVAGALTVFAASHALWPEDTALKMLSDVYLLEFLAGIALAKLSQAWTFRAPGWAFWLGLGLCLTLAAVGFSQVSGDGPFWWTIILAATIVGIGVFTKPAVDPAGVFGAVGNASFSLYLVHMFVIRALAIVAPGLPGAVLWLSMAIASVVAALISYRFVELPLNKFAREIAARRVVIPTA